MVDYVGEMLVDSVELEIGGQRIDKQYGDWMHIWNQLSLPVGLQHGYKLMVGQNQTRLACEDSLDAPNLTQLAISNTQPTTLVLTKYMSHFNFGSVPTQDLLFLLLLFNTTKLKLLLHSETSATFISGCSEENSVVVNGGNGGPYKMLHYLLITSTLTLMNADALPNNHTNTSLLNAIHR